MKLVINPVNTLLHACSHESRLAPLRDDVGGWTSQGCIICGLKVASSFIQRKPQVHVNGLFTLLSNHRSQMWKMESCKEWPLSWRCIWTAESFPEMLALLCWSMHLCKGCFVLLIGDPVWHSHGPIVFICRVAGFWLEPKFLQKLVGTNKDK